MNVPVGYNNNVKQLNTHPDLLPNDESLGTAGIKKSRIPSRSVLGNIMNKGILTNNYWTDFGGDAGTRSEVARAERQKGHG